MLLILNISRHTVQDPESENPKDKKKKASKEVPAVKSKQRRPPDADQDFAKKFGMSVPTYDLLEPSTGVTYLEGGKTKTSSKPLHNLTSATSGSLISTLGPNIRLTKTEYNLITKGGNLSRTNVGGDKENVTNAALKSQEEMKKTDPKEWTIKVGGVKESNFNTTGALRMAQHHREAGVGVNIANQDKLEALLKASEEIKIENMQTGKVDKKQEKFTTDDTLKRSPVDTFNLELLNSKDWGKNTHPGHVTSLPKLPSQQKMQLEQSLGSKTKYPRFRTSNVPSQKDYSELLAATIKGQQIA